MIATTLLFLQAQVGRPFPDLRLPTIDGSRELSITDFEGSRVLLVEFASW